MVPQPILDLNHNTVAALRYTSELQGIKPLTAKLSTQLLNRSRFGLTAFPGYVPRESSTFQHVCLRHRTHSWTKHFLHDPSVGGKRVFGEHLWWKVINEELLLDDHIALLYLLARSIPHEIHPSTHINFHLVNSLSFPTLPFVVWLSALVIASLCFLLPKIIKKVNSSLRLLLFSRPY